MPTVWRGGSAVLCSMDAALAVVKVVISFASWNNRKL